MEKIDKIGKIGIWCMGEPTNNRISAAILEIYSKKFDEIVDWINDFEKPDVIRCCVSPKETTAAIKNLKENWKFLCDIVNQEEKPIKKSCGNCKHYQWMDYVSIYGRTLVCYYLPNTKNCIENKHKYWELKDC